jgi:hypothetical protein
VKVFPLLDADWRPAPGGGLPPRAGSVGCTSTSALPAPRAEREGLDAATIRKRAAALLEPGAPLAARLALARVAQAGCNVTRELAGLYRAPSEETVAAVGYRVQAFVRASDAAIRAANRAAQRGDRVSAAVVLAFVEHAGPAVGDMLTKLQQDVEAARHG